MADEGRLRGGDLRAVLASALVAIHTEYLGRGLGRASTFGHGQVLVTVMHDVLTAAEKSLTRTARIDAVHHISHPFQETIAAEFRDAVERLTRRRALAFIAGSHMDPDVVAELFILDVSL